MDVFLLLCPQQFSLIKHWMRGYFGTKKKKNSGPNKESPLNSSIENTPKIFKLTKMSLKPLNDKNTCKNIYNDGNIPKTFKMFKIFLKLLKDLETFNMIEIHHKLQND